MASSGDEATSVEAFLSELAADKGYQARRSAREAEQARRVAAYAADERSIVSDLRAAGFDVDSVWDLGNTGKPDPRALPILWAHLERGGYPDSVTESLGRLMACKEAINYWDGLKRLYVAPRGRGEEEGVAAALAAAATKAQLEDLIHFATLADHGESRAVFLRPIKRLGGERGRTVLESLRNDPDLGQDAEELLRR